MVSPELVEHDTVALATSWRGVVDFCQYPYRERVCACVCGELLLLRKEATNTNWQRLPVMVYAAAIVANVACSSCFLTFQYGGEAEMLSEY